ncbi:AAA family ATPase [Roseovarius albus]|nr:AAA family ATPase [Roseovarius albus]
MPHTAFTFSRTEDAVRFADALMGASPFSFRSGLFLAGPRRTGKSTFLRQDLMPELQARGVLTIYTDLWADRGADPADLIAETLRKTMAKLANPLQKAASTVGAVKLAGVEITLADVGQTGGLTLADALIRIGQAAGKPVALVVDEAQHALSTPRGIDAMFALKAARDAMNQGEVSQVPALMLVFTGSHRDKLVGLLRNNRQPFFGASVTDMPLLGRGYVSAYVEWLNAWLASTNQIDSDEAYAAFELLGHRPERLEEALRDIALGPGGAAALGDTVLGKAHALRDRVWADYDNDFGELNKTQKAVLEEMVAQGTGFQPFVVATLNAFARRLGRKVTKSTIQSALAELKEKGLIWQSGRGQYALEDQGMIPWLKARGLRP